MKIKVTCNHCKKIYLIEKGTRVCPKCKKSLENSYNHDYSIREGARLGKNQRKKNLIQIEFHHIVYAFILGVAIYIGIIVVQFNNTDVKNETSSKGITSTKKNHSLSNVLTINSTSRIDDVFGYFEYISKEMESLNTLQNSIKDQPNEKDIEKMRDIIFKLSIKIDVAREKQVPNGYENIQLNLQKNFYYKEKYFQNFYDYIISKDPKYIEGINNSIQEGNEAWKLVLDELEVELNKDGINTYRRDNRISISYKKTKYGF